MLRLSTDVSGSCRVDHPTVAYAVVWSENDDGPRAGSLALGSDSLRFGGSPARELTYEEVAGARIDRRSAFRLAGRPTLVIESRAGDRFRVASLDGAGTLHELAERLLSLRHSA